jgi:Flp pilus assembly protein TadD
MVKGYLETTTVAVLSRCAAALLPIALACCGGAAPPAATGGVAPSAPSGAGASAAASLPEPSAPEPPASAEMQAGIKAFDAGNFAEARKAFEAAVKKNQKDYQAYSNLGMACEKLGDKSAA